jgi:predicted transcriptional regulator
MARLNARKKMMAVSAVLLMSLATGLVLVPFDAYAAEDPPPTMHVTLDSANFRTIDISYGRVTASLSGTVIVEKQGIKPETIHMTVEDVPWEWFLTPSDQQVSGMQDSFDFTGSVTVPKGYVVGEVTGSVVATWYDIDSAAHTASHEFVINVVSNPFYLSISDSHPSLEYGQSTDVRFTLTDNSPLGLSYVCNIDGLISPAPLPWLDWSVAGLNLRELVLESGESRYFDLHIEIPDNATTSTFRVTIIIVPEGFPEHTREETIRVSVQGVPIPEPPGTDPDDDGWLPFPVIWLWYMIALGLIVGFVGFLGFTEVGMLMVLWGLLLPMFTRLRRNEVLNQFSRGEIYGFIKANPGVHLTAIKENLDLANGVLAYHLKVLIREEFIVARREGGYKRFYPRDMKVPRKRVHFTRLQLDILDKLRMHPGLTQAALSRMLDESKQVVNYNISVLMAADMVLVERDGGKTRCFVTKDAPKAEAEDEPVFDVEPETAKGSAMQMKL